MAMQIRTKFRAVGLLDYAKQGKEALKHIKRALYASLNSGRRVARQRISSEFQTRTGFLRRQAGKMRPQLGIFMQRRARRGAPSKGSATPYEIGGRITPIPKLINIFERGPRSRTGEDSCGPDPSSGLGKRRSIKRRCGSLRKSWMGSDDEPTTGHGTRSAAHRARSSVSQGQTQG